jgi:hypothetical protein
LSAAFGGQNKKRLNMVFDAIGFIYPNYHYPLRGQGKKRKIAASVITIEPKGKKMKVLTHRLFYIEPAMIPEFGKGTSSAAEAKEVVPIVQSTDEPIVVPKVPTVGPAEDEDDKAKEPQVERVIDLPKMHRAPVATPKRRRMANVLDAMLETTKSLSPAPTKKIVEATKAQVKAETGEAEAEATKIQAEAEARPPAPFAAKTAASEEKTAGQDMAERARSPDSEAQAEAADYIYRHASGKKLSEDEIAEARHYAQKLKYSKGALVFNRSSEDDFLYCLSDNKEISVCREIDKSMGFSKLEDGLSILSKDDLADSLAYNSIKVYKLALKLRMTNFICHAQFFLLFCYRALRAQKNIEDEDYSMALNNLRSEVIELRNEGLEKDKILISLVNKVKEDGANFKARAEAQKTEIEDL